MRAKYSFYLLLFFILLLSSCEEKDLFEGDKVITSIEFAKKNIILSEGDEHILAVNYDPSALPAPNYTFESSDTDVIVIVDNKIAKAVGIGTAEITALVPDSELKATCSISVPAIPASSITLSETSIKLIVGETLTLEATIEPANSSYKEIEWTSNNENRATVENGIVTAISKGEVMIRAAVVGVNDVYSYCKVNIQPTPLAQTIHINTPGTLEAELDRLEVSPDAITDLTISGYIDARDLNTITEMNALVELNMQICKIVEFGIFPENELLDKNFTNHQVLKNITLPVDLEKIPNYAFSYCERLTSIIFPETLTEIGQSAFEYCKSIQEMIIPDNVKSIGNKAFENSEISQVKLPSNLKKITSNLFSNTRLSEIEIPEGVTTIESGAFMGCLSLKRVIIPSTVTNIGNHAFMSNPLEEIYVNRIAPPSISNQTFTNFNGTLYVPQGSRDFYRISWKEFKNIVEVEQ